MTTDLVHWRIWIRWAWERRADWTSSSSRPSRRIPGRIWGTSRAASVLNPWDQSARSTTTGRRRSARRPTSPTRRHRWPYSSRTPWDDSCGSLPCDCCCVGPTGGGSAAVLCGQLARGGDDCTQDIHTVISINWTELVCNAMQECCFSYKQTGMATGGNTVFRCRKLKGSWFLVLPVSNKGSTVCQT